MGVNPNSFVRLYMVIFVLVVGYLFYKVYEQVVFVQKQRKQLLSGFYDRNLENIHYEDDVQKKFKKSRTNARKIMKMKAIIKQVNLNQKVYNEHLHKKPFRPRYIIVIQVHSNVYLLRQLLASLKAAYNIPQALLIFSHDVFDPEINKVIHSINFVKYMQIFYPYSIQLHPNVFPGADRDNTTIRDPAAAQIKHHWWWQMNQVFDHLNITRRYRRPILFLEEDNYVTIDFLSVINILHNTQIDECPTCEMLSLAAHKPNSALYKENATVTLEVWDKKTPNFGLAFDRSIWHSIKNDSREFCYLNDYTWANTLKYMGSNRMDTNYYLTAIDGPRVFRIESCYDSDMSCKPEIKVGKVIDFTQRIHKFMFPQHVSVTLVMSNYFTVKPLGLFSDERDHELCIYFSTNNVWY